MVISVNGHKRQNSNFATKTTKRERVNSLVLLKETTKVIDIVQSLQQGQPDEYSQSEFYYPKHLKTFNVRKLKEASLRK